MSLANMTVHLDAYWRRQTCAWVLRRVPSLAMIASRGTIALAFQSNSANLLVHVRLISSCVGARRYATLCFLLHSCFFLASSGLMTPFFTPPLAGAAADRYFEGVDGRLRGSSLTLIPCVVRCTNALLVLGVGLVALMFSANAGRGRRRNGGGIFKQWDINVGHVRRERIINIFFRRIQL